jgi:hypothetical protein
VKPAIGKCGYLQESEAEGAYPRLRGEPDEGLHGLDSLGALSSLHLTPHHHFALLSVVDCFSYCLFPSSYRLLVTSDVMS